MLFQHLAQLTGQTAQYQESATYYRRAIDALRELRCFDEVAEIASFRAVSLVGAGELDQARWELEMAAGYGEGAAGPDDPVLRPNHRRAAVQMGWSEIALAQGDTESGLRRCRRVLELHAWPSPGQMSGPGTFLTAASVLGAHALYDGLGEVPALPQELIDFMREQLGQYFDMPQMGSVAVAIGSYLLATRRRMVSHICARVRGSSPVVGSSRNSSGGVAIKPAARSRRRRMPPEKFSRALFAASVSPAAPPGSRRRRPAAPRRP